MTSNELSHLSLEMATEHLEHSPYSASRGFPLGPSVEANCPVVTYVRIEPGFYGPRHAHTGWTMNVVIEGSCTLGDMPGVELLPGHVLTAAANAQYGPLVAGPDGVTLYEIFDTADGRTVVWDDPDEPVSAGYQRWFETRSS